MMMEKEKDQGSEIIDANANANRREKVANKG